MKNRICQLVAVLLLLLAHRAVAQVGFNGSYSQNFDSMGTAGTAPPAGWSFFGALGGGNATWTNVTGIPAASVGGGTLNNTLTATTTFTASSNTAGYNFALPASTGDRAIGTSPTSGQGLVLQLALANSTGSAISAIRIRYDIRRFTAPAANQLPGYGLFYSVNGGTTWQNAGALNPTLTGPAGVIVPSTTGVTTVPATAVSLASPWTAGTQLLLRWVDDNAAETSPDQILGLDNVVIGLPVGQPPTVAITSPADGSAFSVGSAINFTASAADTDGTIAKVEFFEGANKLGEDAIAPYELAWTGFAAGTYGITARAADNSGNTTSSAPIAVTAAAGPSGTLTRGPYLNQANQNSIVILWRSSLPIIGRVRYGTSSGSLTQSMDETAPTTEHIVQLTGLNAYTRYYYSVGSALDTLAGGDAGHTFRTSPEPGTATDTRIWVLGDAGRANSNQAAVRDAYYTWTGIRTPDLCLMLGDNAYTSGTDTEYQASVFNMYPTFLRKMPLWSCIGNHDANNGSTSSTANFPYFDMFTFPTNGECGGAVSLTERYYSFDYGNIHFIVLDSQTSNRNTIEANGADGAMAAWLRNDLAGITSTWIVAVFHHPPYSKGSHDSDLESQLIEMRERFGPILETGGVDLVLNGHSHSYERSFFIDNHYGASGTFTPANIKQPGNGRPASGGAYIKPLTGPRDHFGAVYTVTGSAGSADGGALNHPAMFVSYNTLGSFNIDVTGNQLSATYIQSNGALADTFTIIKPNTNADLASLGLNAGTLTPAFSPNTTSYAASVSNATTSITVSPTVADSNATVQVRVNGGAYATVASGSASGALSLNVGPNTVDTTVTAQDGTTTKTYSVTVTVNPPAPVITSAGTASGTVGTAFSYQIVATNSPTSYNATGLPSGLSVNTSTGLISGTPTGSGISSVTLSATNAGGAGTATLTLTVNPPAPVITSATMASGTVGSAFSYQIVATNSPTSYSATGLPAGLSVNTSTGLISGTPTGTGISSVTLSATNAGGTGTATLTLTVNPQSSVQFTSASQNVPESVGTMTVTAQLSVPSDVTVTVPFTVTGTASNSADYTRTNSPLTIPAGQTTGTMTIAVVDEAVNEANETVIVTMGTPTNASKGATSVHTATIIDNDRPTVQFTSASQNALESVGAMIVTAQLSAPTNVAVTVPFTVSGTASKPSDYTISASPLTIPAGQTTGNVTITVVNDAVSAPNETVIITMGTPTNANKGATSVHTATIIDNDTWPTVQFTSASQSALESVGTMTVTVQLSAPTIQDVTIPFTVSGTARNPSDYAISTSPIIIPTGQTSANITISVVNDATSEGSETIIITMATPTGATKGAPTVHTATLIDNDNADLASLRPSVGTLMPAFATATTSYSIGVPGDTAAITVTPTVANSNATVTVNGLPVTSGQPSSLLALNVGSNTITTVVTAQNGTTKRTYTLVVSRAGTTNADLLALVASAGTLSPAFLSTTLAYTASVSNSTLSIQLTPVLADPAATVTVNGAAVVSGTASSPITLYVGSNVINTVVTAQNGTTTKTYKLTVTVTVNPAVAGYYTGLATPTGASASTNPARRAGLGGISMVSTGAYTGKITLGGSSAPAVISGTLATGTATADIVRAGLPTLTLTLTLTADVITGTLTEGTTEVSTLVLNKLLYTSTVPAVAPLMNVPVTVRNPATDKGAYTAILQALTPAEQGLAATAYPQGSGWVTMNVASSGLVTVSGRLGDGQPVSYSNYLSKDNVLPFFISPYSGTGTVSGLVSFRDTPGQSDVDGLDLVWFKFANASDTSYRNGWPADITQNGIKVDLFGSKFIAPLLANVTAQITLSDGNLASALSNHLSVNAASQITVLDPAIGAQSLAVTLATNGSFTGSFLHPVSNKSTSIGGVILQKTQSGSGYFMGLPATGTASQSGSVTISVP